MISDSVELCESDGLFLTHSTDWNKRMTSQNAQCSTWCRFWIFFSSLSKSDSWNSPSLQCLCTCFAMFPTWQYVFTCMMNVRGQTTQSFVTSFGPLCDRSCKFFHWPYNIRSSNKCQVHFRTIGEYTFDDSPGDFNSASLKWWSSMQGVDTW